MTAQRATVAMLSRRGALLLLAACARAPEPATEPAPARAPASAPAASPAPAQPAAAPAGPPGTDVWIAPLHDEQVPGVGTPRNATARPGYDNQPSFTPDGRFVLYTSIRSGGQADIWRYDPARHVSGVVAPTAIESEYSPTPAPDGGISIIRVERDSTQRLWRMSTGGGDFRVVLERVKPVGYHAWGDDTTLALFVLGSPPTLQLANTRTGDARIVDDSIGRSIHRIPGERAISYTRRGADGIRWLVRLDLASGARTRLVQMPEGTEDYAWTPSGLALAARGTELLAWSRKAGAADWTRAATLAGDGLGRVTRLAVSPDGRWLAFVADEAASP